MKISCYIKFIFKRQRNTGILMSMYHSEKYNIWNCIYIKLINGNQLIWVCIRRLIINASFSSVFNETFVKFIYVQMKVTWYTVKEVFW